MPENSDFQGLNLYSWKVGPSTFRAIPELGARLLDWKLNLAGNADRPVIHWPEDAEADQLPKVRGGNPILFPFSARTFHKGKENTWKTPDGRVLPMPRHGFARGGSFELIALDEDGFTARLQATDSDAEAYPYQYRFDVSYRFGMLDMEVTFTLYNDDEVKIPWSAGHHFYFALPWNPGLNRSHYQIGIPAKKAVYHGPDGKLEPAGKPAPIASLDDPAISDRIHFKLKDANIDFGLKNGEEKVRITIGESRIPLPGTTLVTWTEAEDSPFYCVEPWMGPPSAPEHGIGLHFVEPGQSESFKVRIDLAAD